MASPLTHAVVAVTLAAGYRTPSVRFVLLGILTAEIPDLDAIGFWLGVPYGSLWGHRGVTHSILFAAIVGWLLTRWGCQWDGMRRAQLWGYCFLAALSHGLLDAMTDGGLGVAFFSPLDQTRYFFPFRPIHVSSMSPTDVLGPHGLSVLASECLWVWMPCGLMATIFWWWKGKRTPISSTG
jgi:inner membrane protein